MEYTRSGGSAKRLHTGIGAQSGVVAASHARAGLSGPRQMIEGDRGFLEAFANRDKMAGILAGLGENYELLGTGFKAYYAMYPIHAAIQSVETAMADAAMRADDIDRLEVWVGRPAMANTTTIVHPDDPLGAQFSMRFALATTVHRGARTLADLAPADLRDPSVNGLADRIDVQYSEEFGDTQGARVRIYARDGSSVEAAYDAPLGSPGQPMSSAQLAAKFSGMVAAVLGEGRAAGLREQISTIETGTARDVVAALTKVDG
jgi:2-methylcitrate dehydratase PrpD